jgi:GntR family transcriptional regulator, transcriptional repressor for pyruvate dehydrogenase complex
MLDRPLRDPEGEPVTDVFSAIPRAQTTGQVVEQHLKELIRARRLTDGDRLPPERQLAERLGVSRSTLRGALQSLTEQGVLTGRQGAGWTVTPNRATVAANLALYLSLEDVTFDELFAARRAVEPDVAAAAAEHRTEAQLVALQRSIDVMRAAAEPAAYLQADSDFHAVLAAASRNTVFSLLLMPTLDLLQELRRELSGEPRVIAASHPEHEQILDAVRRQDPEAARTAMAAHIDRFVSSSREVLGAEGTAARR